MDPMTAVLLVADWNVDPREVIAAAGRRARRGECEFDLLVPAWLHGLAWAGDPHASVPPARRRLCELERMAAAAGLSVRSTRVGDPDPATAIVDALADHRAAELLVCMHGAGHGPLDLARRARRLTGLPVERVPVARAPREAEVRPQRPPALSAPTPV